MKCPVGLLKALVSTSALLHGEGDGIRVIPCGTQRTSLYAPGLSHLRLQTVELEEAREAQWADLTAFPQQISHKLKRVETEIVAAVCFWKGGGDSSICILRKSGLGRAPHACWSL